MAWSPKIQIPFPSAVGGRDHAGDLLPSKSVPSSSSGVWFRWATPGLLAVDGKATSMRPGYTLTVTGLTFQMSWQYSTMARSDENLPLRAVFRIDIRVQASVSCQAALTRSWQSR